MSIVQRFGKPDLFLTMTANLSWPEIVANLRPGETASNRPDLTTRVFNQKLQAMLHDVVHKHVLGRVVAYTYSIEFQKRGLPHAHLLVILDKEHKTRTPADVNALVSGELPDPANTGTVELYGAVVRQMRHGPCGRANPKCPCMNQETKTCTRNYPREFRAETLFNVGGYPQYRRRDTGVNSGPPHSQDNTSIVPYNRYLLLKYDCHLNVEDCTFIKAVKYLYKYIHKGPDRARLQIADVTDEVNHHLDVRYVTSSEATWRLFRFSLHGKSHVVVRLPVHLPNQENVLFEEGSPLEGYDRACRADTKLVAYFKLNARLLHHNTTPMAAPDIFQRPRPRAQHSETHTTPPDSHTPSATACSSHTPAPDDAPINADRRTSTTTAIVTPQGESEGDHGRHSR